MTKHSKYEIHFNADGRSSMKPRYCNSCLNIGDCFGQLSHYSYLFFISLYTKTVDG